MTKYRIYLVFLLLLGLTVAACGDDDDDNDDSSPIEDDDVVDDDDNNDDNTSADDDDDDNNDTSTSGWEDVAIASCAAPDRTTVQIVLNGNPGSAAEAADYQITSDRGALNVTAINYAPADTTVTLTTGEQKLGVEYTLTIAPVKAAAELTADFTAADTAIFWTYDFLTGNQYRITAYRAEIGEHCVIYIEQGLAAADISETIDAFDNQIYPTETAMFIDAPDIDGNGRILILGLDGGDYFGGYFSPVDSVSESQAWSLWGIHSNAMEMVYINALYGSLGYVGIVPHEFQHLLYHERHGFGYEYWDYHDEGLAEAAVHTVYGVNQGSLDYFLYDPTGAIGDGASLVHWEYANYDYYVQSYLWWIYLAGRLGSLNTLTDIFNLDTGNPNEVDDFIAARLGSDMPTEMMQYELANWAQHPTGPYGYNGLLSFTAATAPTVTAGLTSLNLEPFGGALFKLNETSVGYPGTQGEDIVYAGIDADGNVDLTAPFDVDGGALLVYNADTNHLTWPAQHSGPDLAAIGDKNPRRGATISPAWLDPPPINPYRMDRLEAWRFAMLDRLRRGE